MGQGCRRRGDCPWCGPRVGPGRQAACTRLWVRLFHSLAHICNGCSDRFVNSIYLSLSSLSFPFPVSVQIGKTVLVAVSSISTSNSNNRLLSTYYVSNTLNRASGAYSRAPADRGGTAGTQGGGPLELQVRVEASEHAMHRTDKGDDAPQSQGNANLPTILAVIAGRLPIHILSLSVVANVIISFFFMAE